MNDKPEVMVYDRRKEAKYNDEEIEKGMGDGE